MKFIDFPSMNVKVEGMENIKIPKMMKIKQIYDPFKIENLKGWVEKEMENNLSHKDSFNEKRICITAGSRGIPNLDIIISTIVKKLKDWGAKPFIIPAMGSHAGGTAEGQKDLIASYNITEESMGVSYIVFYGSCQDRRTT